MRIFNILSYLLFILYSWPIMASDDALDANLKGQELTFNYNIILAGIVAATSSITYTQHINNDYVMTANGMTVDPLRFFLTWDAHSRSEGILNTNNLYYPNSYFVDSKWRNKERVSTITYQGLDHVPITDPAIEPHADDMPIKNEDLLGTYDPYSAFLNWGKTINQHIPKKICTYHAKVWNGKRLFAVNATSMPETAQKFFESYNINFNKIIACSTTFKRLGGFKKLSHKEEKELEEFRIFVLFDIIDGLMLPFHAVVQGGPLPVRMILQTNDG